MVFKKGHKHSEETKEKIRQANLSRQSWLGKKHSEETKRKMSEAQKGKKFSKEHRQRLSQNKLKYFKDESKKKKMRVILKKCSLQRWSQPNARKKHSQIMKSKIRTKEHNKKIGDAQKGKIISEEHKKKVSIAMKGRKPPITSQTFEEYYGEEKAKEMKTNISKLHTGKKLTKEHIEILRSQCGEKSPTWRGGLSFEPYTNKWTEKLREKIRKRDGFCCTLCAKSQNQFNEKLHIHHIDYDKKNCSEGNLISLCRRCHLKTNYKRKLWMPLFQKMIQVRNHD